MGINMLTEYVLYFLGGLASLFWLYGVTKKQSFWSFLAFGLYIAAGGLSPIVSVPGTAIVNGTVTNGTIVNGTTISGTFSPEFALLGYVFFMLGVVALLVGIAQAMEWV